MLNSLEKLEQMHIPTRPETVMEDSEQLWKKKQLMQCTKTKSGDIVIYDSKRKLYTFETDDTLELK